MTDSERIHDPATATEQIAAARTAGSQDGTSPSQHPPVGAQAEQPAPATQAAAGSDPGGAVIRFPIRLSSTR